MISILVIGNEILSAQVEDFNLKHMLGVFNQAGYSIDEVRIVRDDIPTLIEAIRELSEKSSYLISSGGVGPTHDDVTFKAYAEAFTAPLYTHPELERMMRSHFGTEMKPSALRMALVPKNTELIYAGSSWPLIKVANCFVLPGLPEIFVRKLKQVLHCLPKPPGLFVGELYTRTTEVELASFLKSTQDRNPEVELGSYPTYEHSEYATQITLKSTDRSKIHAVFGELHHFFQSKGTLVKVGEPRPV